MSWGAKNILGARLSLHTIVDPVDADLPAMSYHHARMPYPNYEESFLHACRKPFLDTVPPQPLPRKHTSPTTRQLEDMLDDGRISFAKLLHWPI